MQREPKTDNSAFKNSNARFETKSSGSNDPPFRKSVSGYISSNTIQRESAFKLAVTKCIFCVDVTDVHDSKTCRFGGLSRGEIEFVFWHFTKFNVRKTDFSQNSIRENRTLRKIQNEKNGLFTIFHQRKTDSLENSI